MSGKGTHGRFPVPCLLATVLSVGTVMTFAAPGAVPAGAATVTSCTESALDAAVVAGGTVSFSSAGVITLTQPLPIAPNENLTIDGGNAVAIGNQEVQIAHIAGGSVTFRNITLEQATVHGSNGVSGEAGTAGTAGAPGEGGAGARRRATTGRPGREGPTARTAPPALPVRTARAPRVGRST